jgi:hypothetical protein
MTNSDNSLKKRSIVFRFQPMDETPDSILLDYLKSTDAPNELALRAMRMCWLAYAYQHSGTKKGQQLKKVAQEMIWVLEGHIEELRAAFGVERPLPTYALATSSNNAVTSSAVQEDSNPSVSSDEFDEDEIEGFSFYAASADMHFNTAGL